LETTHAGSLGAEPTDGQLVEASRGGDREAMDMLLARYRPRVVRWAEAVTRDSHAAEDAAQAALLRAAAKLGTLQDASRFAPWLRRIARRQALNAIRRSRRETPASDAASLADVASDAARRRRSRDAEKSAARENVLGGPGIFAPNDPQELVAERAALRELLSSATERLPSRPREILLDLARGADTEELMARHGVTRGNLYNLISRSRAKAGEERFRAALEAYLAARRREGRPASATLGEPARARPYSLFGVAAFEALRYAKDPPASLTEIMGATGEAFRLGVARGCSWRGISTHDWAYAAQLAMERLGREARLFARKRDAVDAPERGIQLLRLLHESVDRGVPAVVWNLEINEFGLVYGYDDGARTFAYRGHRRPASAWAYERLGRGREEPELFALAIGDRIAPPATDGGTIAGLIRHVAGDEPPMPGFAFGLNGYRLWLDAAERGELDPLGHAYQVAVLCEAREHAVAYLRLLAARANAPARRAGLTEAAAHYETALRSIRRLYPSFPFGYGVGTGNAGGERIAIELGAAMAAETEALRAMKSL